MENVLPKRKNIRIQGYDYSKPGYYFITICTKNRKNILSIIENSNKDKTVGVDAYIDPYTIIAICKDIKNIMHKGDWIFHMAKKLL